MQPLKSGISLQNKGDAAASNGDKAMHLFAAQG